MARKVSLTKRVSEDSLHRHFTYPLGRDVLSVLTGKDEAGVSKAITGFSKRFVARGVLREGLAKKDRQVARIAGSLRNHFCLSDALSLRRESLDYGFQTVKKIGRLRSPRSKLLSALWLARLHNSAVIVHREPGLLEKLEPKLSGLRSYLDVGELVSDARGDLMHVYVLDNGARLMGRVNYVPRQDLNRAYMAFRAAAMNSFMPDFAGLMEFLKFRGRLHDLFNPKLRRR